MSGDKKDVTQLYKPESGRETVSFVGPEHTYRLNFSHTECSFDIQHDDLVISFPDSSQIVLQGFTAPEVREGVFIELEDGSLILSQDLLNAMIHMDDFETSGSLAAINVWSYEDDMPALSVADRPFAATVPLPLFNALLDINSELIFPGDDKLSVCIDTFSQLPAVLSASGTEDGAKEALALFWLAQIVS